MIISKFAVDSLLLCFIDDKRRRTSLPIDINIDYVNLTCEDRNDPFLRVPYNVPIVITEEPEETEMQSKVPDTIDIPLDNDFEDKVKKKKRLLPKLLTRNLSFDDASKPYFIHI